MHSCVIKFEQGPASHCGTIADDLTINCEGNMYLFVGKP